MGSRGKLLLLSLLLSEHAVSATIIAVRAHMLAIIFISSHASLKCGKFSDGISRLAVSAALAVLISLAFVNLRSKSRGRLLAFCLDESGGPGGPIAIPADCGFALVT